VPFHNHHDREDDEDDLDGVTCNRCGETGLYWQSRWTPDGSERSVLFDSATRRAHECRASADDFDDVSGSVS